MKKEKSSSNRRRLVAGSVVGTVFVLALSVVVAIIFWPSEEPKIRATDADIAELGFTFVQPTAFRAYNAQVKHVLLEASPDMGSQVTPTVEISVDLKLQSHDFSPEKLVLDRWPELGNIENFVMQEPRGEWFAGRQGVVLSATTNHPVTGEPIYVEQWVSKQRTGYARLVAFASDTRFGELKKSIFQIARSISVK